MDCLNKEKSQLIVDWIVNIKGQNVIADGLEEININSQFEKGWIEYEINSKHVDTTE